MKKKFPYDDSFSPVCNEIMTKADKLIDNFWDEKLKEEKVNHVCKLKNYHRYLTELAGICLDFLKWAENEFLLNTEEPDYYPEGCIAVARSLTGLGKRWDMKYSGILPFYKLYS